MSYGIMIAQDVAGFLDDLDDKSSRICRDNLKKLKKNPFPGGGRGDKEKLQNCDYYRLHISREYTAIYLIVKNEELVKVVDLLTISQAHKKYGHYGE
ncbi:type II toxin-antitoxin system RelE/ParE family toxin [Halobacterium salinarum]|uniref:type II toxin-antitoxin system RelE/ParE family toxin n=1 Tax=Halobacterium salinarum TaxID=2242 RepID=UPI002556F383|nr:type II toxin-antitoxin system RelE/ParE family toxin [Halobacterium salinarum]MDL0136204.1 type II toxin-antitoxin system RelE/ParE family toxin [Halobacterium salinarum]MDL0138437.1 type II toxin-antitoxin system RelE/ParE family toxin [Halobacterium salinarum]